MLNQTTKALKGIGEKISSVLAQKGLHTIRDILLYLPYKWENISKIYGVDQLIAETTLFKFSNVRKIKNIVVSGRLTRCDVLVTPKKKKKLVLGELTSLHNTGNKIKVIWFNQEYICKLLETNKKYLLKGDIILSQSLTMYNPKILKSASTGIIPVYRKIGPLTSQRIHRIILDALKTSSTTTEFIPEDVFRSFNIDTIPLDHSLQAIHAPATKEDIKKALLRLSLQELLEILMIKPHTPPPSSILKDNELCAIENTILQYIDRLPFRLTPSQKNVLFNFIHALKQKKNTLLLTGDVGSGKSVIAFLLAAGFLNINKSVAIIAPTRILAEQHYMNILKFLQIPRNKLILGFTKSANSMNSTAKIYIGTYRPTSDIINKASLVVLDEEQKFGVTPKLVNSSNTSQIRLFMSATPIPQTLANAFLGVQAIEKIEATPYTPHRRTYVVDYTKLPQIFKWLNDTVNQTNKVLFVFPRINGEGTNPPSLLNIFPLLRQKLNFNVGVLHGKQTYDEQINTINQLKEGKILGLAATNIIEVGLSLKHLNILIIFGPEYFGLSQLHQLRGRIGRYGEKSNIILLKRPDLPSKTQKRLVYFSKTNDGLKLALYDLKNRGAGDLAGGIKQTGKFLKIADPSNLWLLSKAVSIFETLKARNITIPCIIRPDCHSSP